MNFHSVTFQHTGVSNVICVPIYDLDPPPQAKKYTLYSSVLPVPTPKQ